MSLSRDELASFQVSTKNNWTWPSKFAHAPRATFLQYSLNLLFPLSDPILHVTGRRLSLPGKVPLQYRLDNRDVRTYITFRSQLNLSSFVLQVGQPELRLNHLHWIQQKSKHCDVSSKGRSSWRRAMYKRPKSCTSEAQRLNATLAHCLISA